MRVTFLGHVGMYIETEGGSVLCDPWFNPAYFGSWFPFPRNDTLDVVAVRGARLPLHLAPASRPLRPRVARARTSTSGRRCCCRRSSRPPRARAAGARVRRVRAHRSRRAGAARRRLEVAILAMTAPGRRPRGRLGADPARLDRRDPQPERRPAARPRRAGVARARSTRTSPSSRARSGTRWSTTSRPTSSARLGIRKRADQMERAIHYLARRRRAARVPGRRSAVLPRRRPLRAQRPRRRPGEHLPGPADVPRRARGSGSGRRRTCSCRARSRRSPRGECTVEQPGGALAPDAIFADKRAYLERYRADWADVARARRGRRWPRGRYDVVAELRGVVRAAARRRAATRGAASAARCCCTSATSACSSTSRRVTVREWAGEPVVHRIDVDRALVESLIERHVEDWVNELFLSCRFRAHREGPYNEYVYTFFKCLSLERMAYCEGYYATHGRAGRRDVPLRRLHGAEALPAPARRPRAVRHRRRTACSSARCTTGASSSRPAAASRPTTTSTGSGPSGSSE